MGPLRDTEHKQMFLLALRVLNMCVRMCVCMCWRGDVKVQGGGCACGNWGG